MTGDEAMSAWDKANAALKAGDFAKAEELAAFCCPSDAKLIRDRIAAARAKTTP